MKQMGGCGLPGVVPAHLMTSVQTDPIAVQDHRLGGCLGPSSSGNALQSYGGVGTAACWGPSREAQQVSSADGCCFPVAGRRNRLLAP